MVTSDVQEKRRRLLVRVGRHIPCNAPEAVKVFLDAATKMLDNIIKAPEEPKYRELRAANAAVSAKLLHPHGGKEFLHLLGFEKIFKHGEAVYFMTEVDLEYLAQAKQWLQQQAAAATAMAPAAVPGAQACAECVIQVRLTSGQTLEGGFYAHETVRAVYDFVRSSVVNAEEALLLRAPGHHSFTADKLDMTLQDAGLAPRAVLQVVKSGPEEGSAAEAMDEARRRARQQEREAHEQLRMIKETKMKEQVARDAEKARILSEFKHDREKTAHQGGLMVADPADQGFEETKAVH
eukprot:TRINITY_DN18960_c0_g1_i1.p2 TRINITY_DN18960_c0_g1~~TRINITY_DN18960_c0_g1_i1.p2  ORF type:complete len:312 (+),score=130.89 TRINITY_DN18960_c0_g1_i1:58-936(+)